MIENSRVDDSSASKFSNNFGTPDDGDVDPSPNRFMSEFYCSGATLPFGNEHNSSQYSPLWKKNRHVSPLERFGDSHEEGSLMSYEASPSKELYKPSTSRTQYQSPSVESNRVGSAIYSTMKVNKTPFNEDGKKIQSNFPPVELIEGFKHSEEEFQTFELITYDKDGNVSYIQALNEDLAVKPIQVDFTRDDIL